MALKTWKQVVDRDKLEQAISEIRAERDELKKRQARLRTRECRYKKMLIDFDQMELLEDD